VGRAKTLPHFFICANKKIGEKGEQIKMPKQLNVNLAFTADTSKASS